MKKVTLSILCYILTSGFVSAQQQTQSQIHRQPSSTTSPRTSAPSYTQNSSPPQMTGEEAFYYNVAIFGNPDSFIDSYAEFFDANNYKRAMADEFERARYRAAIHQKLLAGTGEIDFSKKFTFISAVRLGEYSFENHAFPIVNTQGIGSFSDFNYYVAGRGFDVDPFVAGYAVNGSDFSWALPMSEVAGSAFVRGRADRGATIKIIYSVTRKAEQHSNRSYFVPFIYSMEIYDNNTGQKLGVLPKVSSLVAPPLNRADQQLADQRANEQRDRALAEASSGQMKPSDELKALQTPDCTEGEQRVPVHSNLVFVVSSLRECWTPWLVLDGQGFRINESANVLVQYAFQDGTVGTEFEDGPNLSSTTTRPVRKIRLKSLRKGPATITLNAY